MLDRELETLKWKRGQAVYFDFVHVKKARSSGEGGAADGRNLAVEGKSRRMLVLQKTWWCDVSSIIDTKEPTGANDCTWYRAKGLPGYLVLELQKKCPEGLEDWCSPQYWGLLEKGKPTVVSYIPFVYPEKCCSQNSSVQPKRVDESVVNDAIKVITQRGLGQSLFDPQLLETH